MAVYNIYYSPTGGTKKVADILANAMSDNVQNIDLFKKDRFGNCFNKDDICILLRGEHPNLSQFRLMPHVLCEKHQS